MYIFFPLVILLIFCRTFFKKRISDREAKKIFTAKNIPLKLADLYSDKHRIHYAITGNDSLPTLVFIHGSPGSWGKYMQYMLDEDLLTKYRIVSIDRPGFGFSNFGEALHLAEQCKLIEAVLQKIKNNKPVFLVGHSYSGAVVTKLAADNPDLFTSIIIVAGAIDPAQEKREMWREVLDVKPLYYFIPGVYQPSNTELLLLKNDLLLLTPDLKNISCNVFFIHGDNDKTVPVENVAYGKRMMTNARSIKIDTLHTNDHMIPMSHFTEVKNILLGLY